MNTAGAERSDIKRTRRMGLDKTHPQRLKLLLGGLQRMRSPNFPAHAKDSVQIAVTIASIFKEFNSHLSTPELAYISKIISIIGIKPQEITVINAASFLKTIEIYVRMDREILRLNQRAPKVLEKILSQKALQKIQATMHSQRILQVPLIDINRVKKFEAELVKKDKKVYPRQTTRNKWKYESYDLSAETRSLLSRNKRNASSQSDSPTKQKNLAFFRNKNQIPLARIKSAIRLTPPTSQGHFAILRKSKALENAFLIDAYTGQFIADVEREKWKRLLFHFRAEESKKRVNTPRLAADPYEFASTGPGLALGFNTDY